MEMLLKIREMLVAQCAAEYEAQNRQLIILLPVFLAVGIAVYFSLPVEPPFWLGGVAFGIGVAVWIFLRRFERILPLFILLAALGFCAAQVRSYVAYTPILQKEIKTVDVSGTIVAVEDFGEEGGGRLLLSDVEIEDLPPEQTPVRVRLKTWKNDGLYPGMRVSTLASLTPPSPPVIPGGFDFQRYLYFQQIGAVGFIYKILGVEEAQAGFSLKRDIEKLRLAIEERINEAVGFPEAATITALTVGRMSAISDADNEAMRQSGLAHMLSISGLHVGLISGAIFFVVRLLLVMIPGFALRFPVKKYAAVAAIAGAFIYMLLAGAPIPTQRSTLMTAVFFLAVMIDRSPFSMRMLAFAAFVVLLFFPESLMSASFQMSFGAVAGLVAFFEWLQPYWTKWHGDAGMVRRAGLYLAGICFTTVIATIATAPFSLFHFQQLATYGLISNLLAIPIMSFLIMPAILGAVVVMPLGLEFVPLWVAKWGVRCTLDIAHWTSSLPYAALRTEMWPVGALVLAVLAAMMLVVLKTRLRALAIIPIAVSLVFISIHYQYDVLVSSSSKLVSVRGGDGRLYVSNMRSDKFARENWVRAYGMSEDGNIRKWPKEGAGEDGAEFISCDREACRVEYRGRVISYLREESAVRPECAAADIVIAPFPVRACDADAVIDLMDARAQGAHGLRIGDAIAVETSNGLRGKRPWSSLNSAFLTNP